MRPPLTLGAALLFASLLASCEPTTTQDLLAQIRQLCSQSAFVVTTAEEGLDPDAARPVNSASPLCGLVQRPGGSPAPCTLREALYTAAFCGGHHTVELAPGTTYTLTRLPARDKLSPRERGQDTRVGPVGLPRVFGSVTLIGHGAVIERISAVPFRFFHVPPNANLTLHDVTLRQGASTGAAGGAVHNEGSLATEAVTFVANRASDPDGALHDRGGAVYNAGTFTTVDTVFESNQATWGGALYNAGGARLTTSTLRSNSASQGSAVYHDDGTLVVQQSTFVANGLVSSEYGALFVHDGTVRLDQSTFVANVGRIAGAVNAEGGTLMIERSTFQGQRSGAGGAVSCSGSTASITFQDVTIAGNASDTRIGKGGVSTEGGCALTFTNSLVAQNTPRNCGFATGSGTTPPRLIGSNLASDSSCGFSVGDPNLLSLSWYGGQTQTMPPRRTGPVVDAGTGSCRLTDQRGQPRTGTGPCDIGAVELQPDEG